MTDSLITFGASYLPYALLALLGVFALWRRHIILASVAVVAAGIARFTLKPFILLFVHRARPNGEGLDSFPSGHALFFFVIATIIYGHNKRWGVVFYVGATLMGIARVLDNMHWPTDIIGGALIGILVGLLVNHLYARLRHKS
jgi:membrane-associated phospholipid phosphatase